MNDEVVYCLALSHIKGLTCRNVRLLYESVGNAKDVLMHINDLTDKCINIRPKVLQILHEGVGDALDFAKREIDVCERKGIRPISFDDENYPSRVRECDEAPLVLFYCGTANLNSQHMISMVGTRKISEYGRDICNLIIREISKQLSDVVIVSGMAYGVDIECHRASMKFGMDTVAVLAHGLDRIYPELHRADAVKMSKHGGLLTEYPTKTTPLQGNFVRRNRIVASMCDACIVVESPNHGGSLITASLSFDYNREVFACPGRLTDVNSSGCNRLIANQSANIFTSVDDFMDKMNWKSHEIVDKALQKGIQREFFPELTPHQQSIVDVLTGSEGMVADEICRNLNSRVQAVSSDLFQLEMQGIVRLLPGGVYRVIL